MNNKPIVIIPARFGSKRLPGKPLADLPQSEGEQRERLEQLRALGNGMHIRVVPVIDDCGQEVNTLEDLKRANDGC